MPPPRPQGARRTYLAIVNLIIRVLESYWDVDLDGSSLLSVRRILIHHIVHHLWTEIE